MFAGCDDPRRKRRERRAAAAPALTLGERGEGVDEASHVLAHILVGGVYQVEHTLLWKMAAGTMSQHVVVSEQLTLYKGLNMLT